MESFRIQCLQTVRACFSAFDEDYTPLLRMEHMDKFLMIIDDKIVVFAGGLSGCGRRKYLKIARLKEEKVR